MTTKIKIDEAREYRKDITQALEEISNLTILHDLLLITMNLARKEALGQLNDY